MAGKKGRSGRRPLSVAEHVLKRTFRADRHARPTNVATAAATRPEEPVPPPYITVGLREEGVRFVVGCWLEYGPWSSADLALLRQAAELVDDLERHRLRLLADGDVVAGARGMHPHPLLKVQREARVCLLAIVSALNLGDE